VAPGFFTYSAKASGSTAETCEIIEMAGTSMATPCVSGNAAIIRQYFVQYNSSLNKACTFTTATTNLALSSGYCDMNSNPRGATIKAMLIHSGQPMTAYYSTARYGTQEPNALLASPPDMYQAGLPLLSLSFSPLLIACDRDLVVSRYKISFPILGSKRSCRSMSLRPPSAPCNDSPPSSRSVPALSTL
jgi:hypothetical protein